MKILLKILLLCAVSVNLLMADEPNPPVPVPRAPETATPPQTDKNSPEELFLAGKYDECLKVYEETLQKEPENENARVGVAEVLFTKGDYKKSDEILQAVLTANPGNLKARYLACQLSLELGKYDACEKLAEPFTSLTTEQVGKLSAGERLTLMEGLWFYGTRKGDKELFHLVNGLMPQISAADKNNPAVYTFWGFCYLDKDDVPEAVTCFTDALKVNPNYAAAHLGLARCAFVENPEAALGGVMKALSINPNLPEALEFQAVILLALEKEEEALKSIEKALKINPNSVEFLATRASVYYLNNDLKEFDDACRQVLTINPKPARFYYILGNNCASMLRMLYLDAQPFYQKAVELDPKLWDGYTALGMNGLKCGADAEEEARRVLEESYKRDPFHPTVVNTLKVLDALQDEFVSVKTEHLTIKLNKSEAEMLQPYITKLLEKDYKQFNELWHFAPAQPLLCEVFPSMNDFSVRLAGIQGIDFALGVCFAKTFLVYSPEVQEKLRRRFHWGTVTTHEFMHVFTLQLSKFRVPRWFTEGCSVWSEGLPNPGWKRVLEMQIYEVYEAGKLKHMADFAQNKGFDLVHTYLLSSIIIEYIYQKYGIEKITAMLKAFGERKKHDVVFKECLGKTLKEFDQEFFNYFENDWIKRIKIRKPPRLAEEADLKTKLAKNAEDEEALAALARISLVQEDFLQAQDYADKALFVNPKNTEALITMGEIYFQPTKRRYEKSIEYFTKALKAGADDFGTHFRLAVSYLKNQQPDEAITEFTEAKRCFPRYVKYEDNPYYYLAQIYGEKGEQAKMIAELEAYLKIAYEDFTTAMKLAKIYRDSDKNNELIALLENIVYLEPKDLKVHAWLAGAYRAKKQWEQALTEYQVEIFLLNKLEEGELRNKWLSNFHCDMAEIYKEKGDTNQARQFVGQALQENADNNRARQLLDGLKE